MDTRAYMATRQFWKSFKRLPRDIAIFPIKPRPEIDIWYTRSVIVTSFRERHRRVPRLRRKKKYFTMVTSPHRRNFYDRQGNYFPPCYRTSTRGFMVVERHSRRETKEGLRRFSTFSVLRVSLRRACHRRASEYHGNAKSRLIRARRLRLLPFQFSRSF